MFNKRKIVLVVSAFVTATVLVGGSFFWGIQVGKKMPQTLIVQGAKDIEPPETVSADFGSFWQAWKFINDNYLRNKDITTQEKLYGAIGGLVRSLEDPNSVFFSPEENTRFQQDIQGSFSGIGAELGIRKDQLVIIAPLKGTPASRAGLEPGDQILKINTTSTDGITIDKAVNFIRGPENTEVILTIFRKGWEKSREIKIIRAPIVAPTLDYEMKNGNIAYIQIHSFNANVNFLFYRAAFQALSEGARGIVLDVRNDPGGYLDVAVDLAGWFLPRGTLIVKETSRGGTAKEFRAAGNAALADLPVIVLINPGSASASEILAGTLRDNRGVKLVGEQSFGKGTVQQLETLKDGSLIKITIANWVLPKGQILEGTGLKPDIEVKKTDQDIENKRDPQLEKALEIIQGQIGR